MLFFTKSAKLLLPHTLFMFCNISLADIREITYLPSAKTTFEDTLSISSILIICLIGMVKLLIKIAF